MGRNGTTHDEVVARVRTMLVEGEIPPGARVPEQHLCAMLGVSRTPLREALKVLAAEGLVVLLPNRGARAALLTSRDLHQLFEVAEGLEALAGELACARITEAELDELRALHRDMADHYARRDLAGYFACNRAIHEAIIRAADNTVLAGLYESVSARIRRARYRAPMPAEQWAIALREHDAILAALELRDGPMLAAILKRHLRHKRDQVEEAGFAETSIATPSLAGALP